MKSKLMSGALLALLATGSMSHAQKIAKASAIAPEPEQSLRVAVTGLTANNAEGIKTTLSALVTHVYVCDPCQVEKATAAQCPRCNTPLQAATRPLLAGVAPAPDYSSIALALDPRHATRLSEIDATLKKSAVTMDLQKLPLPGRVTLVIGGAHADQVTAVEKALLEAKLFEEVHPLFDAATSQIRVQARSKVAPTRAAVASIVEAQKLQLADVVFGTVEG